MKISLVTINRNNAEGLRRTLRSIAAQSAGLPPSVHIEHIVVDGLSDDNSLDMLLPELQSKIISSPPQGIYNALNIGLRNVSGDIVGLLHAGDSFAQDDVMALIANTFADNEDIDFIWGDVRIGRRLYSGRSFTPRRLITGFAPPHPSLYMRKSALERIGLYDESYRTAADFEYFVRLFNDTSLKGCYIPRVMVDMQTGGQSQSLVSRLRTNNRERLRALAAHGLPAKKRNLLIHYKYVIKGFLCSSKKK